MNKLDRHAVLLVTLAVFLQVLLAAVDTTIISTAMPTVVASLGGLRWYSWVFSAYMIASTIATPIAGKLSDQLSRKRMYLASIGAFLAASMLCGLSPNMAWLIACRALQGAAGGAMFAVSLGLIGLLYPPHQRGKVQGFISSLWAIASIIGPPLGGYVVEHFSWRWTFYLNLPIGLPAMVFIARFLHDTRSHNARQQVDYPGATVLALLMVGLLLGVTHLEQFSLPVAAILAAALLLLGVLLWFVEKRAAAPIVPLALLRRHEIAAANLATLTTGIGAFSLILFAPLFVQGVLLGTATQAGLVLLPMSFGWAAGSFISGHLVNRAGYRPLASAGALLMVVGFLYQMTLAAQALLWEAAVVCACVGLGMGLVTTSVTVAVQNNVHPQDIGVATASTIFSRALGAAVGVGALGAVLAHRVAEALRDDLPHAAQQAMSAVRVLLLPEARAQISPELLPQLRGGLAAGLQTVFVSCAVISALALLVSLSVSNHRPRQENV